MNTQLVPLNQLPINCLGKVKKLNCHGDIKRRMLDLGIVVSTPIKPILKSPSGDPTAYEVRGSIIALRKEDSENITVSIDKRPVF